MSKVEIVPVYLGGSVTSKETKRGETVFTFAPAPLARFYQIRKDGRVVDTALTKPVAERRARALKKQTGGGKRSMIRRAHLLQRSAVRSHVPADTADLSSRIAVVTSAPGASCSRPGALSPEIA